MIKMDNLFKKEVDSLHEFRIAKQLYKLDIELFPTPRSCIVSDKLYIVYEKIQGKSLYEILPELQLNDFKQILHAIFYGLFIAWNKYRFVHGDLHLSNILIRSLDCPKTIFSQNSSTSESHPLLQFKEPIYLDKYIPVIIDFEKSSIEGQCIEGQNPCDKDNRTILDDIWKLLGCLHMYLTDDKGEYVLECIEHFIDRFEFQERKEEFAMEWFQKAPINI
jgi:RIO-like serine/threonine protein kinase